MLSTLRTKQFWKWFIDNQHSFDENIDSNPIFEELGNKLRKINPILVYEMSPRDENEVRVLAISCDGIREGVSLVQDIVASAPNIPGWKIVAFKQPIYDNIRIEMNGINLGTQDLFFTYNEAEDDMVDIKLYVKGMNENNKDVYMQASFVLLDAAIGEYLVMTRMRYIDAVPLLTGKYDLHPLSEIAKILS